MPVAWSILPNRFADGRHRSIERGLEAAGYCVRRGFGLPSSVDDVLVTWTVQRGAKEEMARRFEAAGGRVVVAEEPHLKGMYPASHAAAHQTGGLGRERLLSLSLHDHQHSWRVGGAERWAGFGVTLAPWRDSAERRGHILVRDQRGIGSAPMRSPEGWGEATAARLQALTGRRVILRPHPKRAAQRDEVVPALAEALRGASCLVTWASHEGTEALIAGVPVVWCAPCGFVRDACGTRLADAHDPPMPDRLPVFERFAWSQWRVGEIESGAAFRWTVR